MISPWVQVAAWPPVRMAASPSASSLMAKRSRAGLRVCTRLPFYRAEMAMALALPTRIKRTGADATTYLTAGGVSGSQATLTFGATEMYMGLLWGSVDSFNTLSFYNGATLVGTVTGSQVLASPNGDQGVNGTVYVNINSTLPFDSVVATSSLHAFEFDNVAYNKTAVPEPTTMIAGALLLLPFGASTLRILRKSRTA